MNTPIARFAMTAGSSAALLFAPLAVCEPIVETFEPDFRVDQRNIELPSINPAFPDLTLIDFVFFGMDIPQEPSMTNPGYDSGACGPRPFACEQLTRPTGQPQGYESTPIGAIIDDTLSGWQDAYGCTEFMSQWPTIMRGSLGFYGACGETGDCPFLYAYYSGPSEPEDGPVTAVVPIRVEGDGGAWHYAWVAFRIENVTFPDCINPCWDEPNPDLPENEDIWTYLGFGYETEPGVPIFNGGGLCESDLNFDAVLDLADVQSFAQAFVAADGLADMNDDGILDLADVQRFVGSFNTGCGL